LEAYLAWKKHKKNPTAGKEQPSAKVQNDIPSPEVETKKKPTAEQEDVETAKKQAKKQGDVEETAKKRTAEQGDVEGPRRFMDQLKEFERGRKP